MGILKFLISLGWSSICLVLEVDRQQRKEHRSFQERCAIACAHAHTYLKGFKSDKLHAQIKLLTRRCITNEGKTAKNEWENDGSDFLQALHSVCKKLGQFFFHTYLLTCLKKDTSVLLKVVNI